MFICTFRVTFAANMLVLITVFTYFAVLLLFSRFITRTQDNETFFCAGRRSPWYLVAFGMVGASISGVTFVSVPGMVVNTDMTYLQTCLGFILGYVVVAFLLLPVYYRLNLTSIYSYLAQRFGSTTQKTGASFFLLSKMAGAAVKFYVVILIIYKVLAAQHSSLISANGNMAVFALTTVVLVGCIWLYTRRGGIRTLVFTDTLQTTCMLAALLLIIYQVVSALDLSAGEAVKAIANDAHSRIFVFDDWLSSQNFWKQFVSGIFIVIVMTGLDQDMMQKNLTCKTLREAQKDMCTYGFAFVPVNLLFLSLGILLLLLAQKEGVAVPTMTDELLPSFVLSGTLGSVVTVLFTVGIVAASFSSADSALTSLTTSYCIDIRERPHDEQLRRRAHLGMAAVFVVFILLFHAINSTSLIDAVYTIVSYTYGPLLGLFAFGLLTRYGVNNRAVPYIAVASPVVCFALSVTVERLTGYRFGYELLMLNGLLTFVGLWACKHTHTPALSKGREE